MINHYFNHYFRGVGWPPPFILILPSGNIAIEHGHRNSWYLPIKNGDFQQLC